MYDLELANNYMILQRIYYVYFVMLDDNITQW